MKENMPPLEKFPTLGSQRSTRRGIRLPRVVENILWISCPTPNHFKSNIYDQERLRRSRILSVLLLLVPIVGILSLPITLITPEIKPTLITIIGLGIVSGILNRIGQTTLAALGYVLSVTIAITILVTSSGWVLNVSIPDYDLYMVPTLIASLILPRRYLPFEVIIQMAIIIGIYFSLPKDQVFLDELARYRDGSLYSGIFDAILLQITAGIVGFLGATSMERALIRASRAEELAEARSYIDEQNTLITQQKQRLEQGIAVLKETQSRVANGDYSARAQLQDNELFPLAISFNLLVERLAKLGNMEQDYRRLWQAVQVMLEARNRLAYGERSHTQTGTQIDQVIILMERYYACIDLLGQSVSLAEEIRVTLQRQQTNFSQLEATLARSQSQQSAPQVRPTILESTLMTRPLDRNKLEIQPLGSAGNQFALSQSQKQLSDIANLCDNARQANIISLQKLRALFQMLSVEVKQGHD